MLGISYGSVQSIVKDKWPEKQKSKDWFLHQNITLALTDLSVHKFLRGEEKMTVLPNASYWSGLVLWWIQFFPRTQDGIKRREMWWHHHNSSRITGCTCQVSNSALPRMFWMAAQLRGSLYVMPRKLFWRGQYWLEGKCCCFEGINSVQKLSTPHTFPAFTTYNSYTPMYNSTLPHVHAYMQA